MIYKMLIFDLDGTILTSDNIVSPKTSKILQDCKHKGYKIGFITGRSKSERTIKLLANIPYDFSAFYNGAEIYSGDYLIESNVLPYKQANLILNKLSHDFPDIQVDIHQMSSNVSFVSGSIKNEIIDEKSHKLNELPKQDVKRIRLKSDSLISIPLKCYMTSDSIFFYTVSGDVIIVHKNATKGHAIKTASFFLGIPLSQMIAFGDDENDLDMIRLAGTGVAMGNAIPIVKNVANHVTDTNDSNGIVTWIIKHLF